ncbi:MAG: hypothetical protein GYA02_04855 [Clostridiaceae bacterium]|nr:hypothetical protein [Clostridiaceae bacterium]
MTLCFRVDAKVEKYIKAYLFQPGRISIVYAAFSISMSRKRNSHPCM